MGHSKVHNDNPRLSPCFLAPERFNVVGGEAVALTSGAAD